jgi:hypothetical protein
VREKLGSKKKVQFRWNRAKPGQRPPLATGNFYLIFNQLLSDQCHAFTLHGSGAESWM